MTETIPLYIIEEHHEAYGVWLRAAKKGIIDNHSNILMHVDDHSDMSPALLNTEVQGIEAKDNAINKFVYDELNIASFIVPACYIGLINQVYWVRQKHKKPGKIENKLFVRSYNKKRKKMIMGGYTDEMFPFPDPDRIVFDYITCEAKELPEFNKKFILDIDLDYFSCIEHPSRTNPFSIEITKEQYEHFLDEKFHPLKLYHYGRLEARKKNDNYYLAFNEYNEYFPSSRKVSEDVIKQRVDDFIAVLDTNKYTPALIDICRSRYSGYTPEDQWIFIEKTLCAGLNKLYNLKAYSI